MIHSVNNTDWWSIISSVRSSTVPRMSVWLLYSEDPHRFQGSVRDIQWFACYWQSMRQTQAQQQQWYAFTLPRFSLKLVVVLVVEGLIIRRKWTTGTVEVVSTLQRSNETLLRQSNGFYFAKMQTSSSVMSTRTAGKCKSIGDVFVAVANADRVHQCSFVLIGQERWFRLLISMLVAEWAGTLF